MLDRQRPSSHAVTGGNVARNCPQEVPRIDPALNRVFHAFDRSDVCWCVFGDPKQVLGGAPYADVLIPIDDRRRVAAILFDHHFMHVGRNAREIGDLYVAYEGPAQHWVELRIRTDLSLGDHLTVRSGTERACLARRVREGGIYALQRDDRFWTLLLDSIPAQKACWPCHASRLQQMAADAMVGGPVAAWIENHCPRGWTPSAILACVDAGAWDALWHFGRALRTTWRRLHWLSAAAGWLRRYLRVALTLVKQSPGTAVALLGPDGCGKSSLATQIAEHYYFPVRFVYMGLWRRTEKRQIELWLPGWSVLGRLLRIWYLYLLGRYHRMLGRLVIFDRYIYDSRLSLGKRRPVVALVYAWILGHACPAPDLVLFLDAPGEVMHARKGESSPEQLEQQRRAYLSLRSGIRWFHVVDATRPQQVVCAEAIELIWRRRFG